MIGEYLYLFIRHSFTVLDRLLVAQVLSSKNSSGRNSITIATVSGDEGAARNRGKVVLVQSTGSNIKKIFRLSAPDALLVETDVVHFATCHHRWI